MRVGNRARTVFAWVAVCALLLAACMPTLVRALSSGSEGQILCSSAAPSWATASVDGQRGAPLQVPPTQDLGEHCPWCSLDAVGLGLPPVPLLAVPRMAPHHGVPPWFLTAPRTRHAWALAQPRAPPLNS